MARLKSFTFISLNGCYKNSREDISWHEHGSEESAFSLESLMQGDTLLFGRKTYEMMVGFWTSEAASNSFPEVAEKMNKATKLVASNSLKAAKWQNTTVLSDPLVENIKNLKINNPADITILGSGSLLRQLSEALLIDEYQIMIDPVFIQEGVSVLDGLMQNIPLKLKEHRVFKSGTVVLVYGLDRIG